MSICSVCKSQNPDNSKFCQECGAPLAAKMAPSPHATQVTTTEILSGGIEKKVGKSTLIEIKTGFSYPLVGEVTVIGRDKKQSDVAFENDRYISRRHTTITKRGDKFYVEDLQSTNGTFVNNQLLNSPRILKPGDMIKMGDTELLFKLV